MQDQLRNRLIGAVILVSLGVIFIPMVLDRTPQTTGLSGSPVPGKAGHKFEPLDIPLEPPPPKAQPTQALIERAQQEAAAAAAAAPPPVGPATSTQGMVTRDPPGVQPAHAPPARTPPAKPAPATAQAAPAAAVPPVPVTPPPAVATADEQTWIVQVGSFASADNAQKLKDKLRGAGFPAFIERITSQDGSATAYKVRVGPIAERDEAEVMRTKLSERMSLAGIVVRYR